MHDAAATISAPTAATALLWTVVAARAGGAPAELWGWGGVGVNFEFSEEQNLLREQAARLRDCGLREAQA